MFQAVPTRLLFTAIACTLAACGGTNDVIVDVNDTYDHASGRGKKVIETEAPYVSATILVGGARATAVEGAFDGRGRYTFADVPTGENVLELRFAADDDYPTDLPEVLSTPQRRRSVHRGERYWYRHGIERNTDAREVMLDADGLDAWQTYDTLTFISRRGEMARTFRDDDTQIAPSATSVEGIGFDFQALANEDYFSGVSVLDASDDLSIFQRRSSDGYAVIDAIEPYSPYYWTWLTRAVAIAHTVEAAEDVIAASFTPAPTTPYTLDLRGSTFASLRDELGLPAEAYANANVSVIHEPGDDASFFVGLAPAIVEFGSASSAEVPVNPVCYPDFEDTCDAVACPDGCDASTTDETVDPDDITFTFDAPHPISTPGTEMLLVRYTYYVPFRHPVTNASKTLSVAASIMLRFDGTSATPLSLTLGPPRDVRLDGMLVPPVATDAPSTFVSDVGLTPTLSWSAPTLGTPEYYEVVVTELESATGTSGASRTRRQVARLRTHGHTMTIPPDVLVDGRIYYATVEAYADGRDLEDLRVSPRDRPHLRTSAVVRPFTP